MSLWRPNVNTYDIADTENKQQQRQKLKYFIRMGGLVLAVVSTLFITAIPA